MEQFNQIIGTLAGIVWGPWLTFLLVGTGVYYTIGTRFLQIRKFGYIMKQTFGTMFKAPENGEGTLKPFQAATTALSATVGVGNIVGVASAVSLGGPGAIFWMWVSAFFGMCTKYAEIVLVLEYREQDEDGNFFGSPAFYMKKGLKLPALGALFSVIGLIACLGSGMVQSNAVAGVVGELMDISPAAVGIILIVLVGIVIIGGVKRLGKVTERLVPFMVVFYLLGAIAVLISNASAIPGAIGSIFTGAFTTWSVGGGVAGYVISQAIRFGIARGLYSNEAGMGSAPIAHAAAITDCPSRQGMWGVFEVFVDTIIIATLTGLAILTSGVFTPDVSPAILTAEAFGTVTPIAKYIVGISLALFAYSTIVGIWYYGQTHTNYLGGVRLAKIYTVVYIPIILLGAIGGLQTIWGIFDVALGFLVIPNLITLLLLSPIVFKRTKEFFDSNDLQKNN